MTNLIPTYSCALALIRHQGRFLMIQESKESCRDLWSFPGGRIDPGEPTVEGIIREVMEESGVVVNPTALLRLEHARMLVEGAWKERFRFVFDAEYVSGDAKETEDEESQRAAWFTPEEVRGLALREELSLQYITDFETYQRMPLDQLVYWIREFD